ncbi:MULTISPECIES: BTH_I0359 family protein [unclassified Burkholderia]
MQMIYNSPNYCVVEFPPQAGHHAMNAGGYEIVDKNAQREIFIDGELATRFREHVKQLIEDEPSLDEVDEFLGQFDSLMTQPVVLH